jgi:hypothetical protein
MMNLPVIRHHDEAGMDSDGSTQCGLKDIALLLNCLF